MKRAWASVVPATAVAGTESIAADNVKSRRRAMHRPLTAVKSICVSVYDLFSAARANVVTCFPV
jgi:hypothetical protein